MLKVFSTEHQDYKVTKAAKKCVSKHLCPILFELTLFLPAMGGISPYMSVT